MHLHFYMDVLFKSNLKMDHLSTKSLNSNDFAMDIKFLCRLFRIHTNLWLNLIEFALLEDNDKNHGILTILGNLLWVERVH